jgi:hypothetical protein
VADDGLLKSASGKPEGPYEEIGRVSNRVLDDRSLFEDCFSDMERE